MVKRMKSLISSSLNSGPNVIIDKVVVQVNNKPDVVYSNNTVQEQTPQEKYKMSKLLKVETRNQKLKSLE